jgi:FkbM family methyltransferase
MSLQAIRDSVFDFQCRFTPYTAIGKVRLPLDSEISTPLRRTLSDGTYEQNEMEIVARTLTGEDRVLECGAGLGLLSAYCALAIGSEKVRTYEANPFMASLIAKTYALNNVSPSLVIGAIGPRVGQLEFHIRHNFWASSSHPDRAEGAAQTITVPMLSLDEEVRRNRPTYLFIDIEGAEQHLAGCSELPGVCKVMTEVHPELIGESGVAAYLDWLRNLGFVKDEALSREREFFFSRD